MSPPTLQLLCGRRRQKHAGPPKMQMKSPELDVDVDAEGTRARRKGVAIDSQQDGLNGYGVWSALRGRDPNGDECDGHGQGHESCLCQTPPKGAGPEHDIIRQANPMPGSNPLK